MVNQSLSDSPFPSCSLFCFFVEELVNAKEHPAASAGIGLAAGLVLMRGITSSLITFNIYNVSLRRSSLKVSHLCLLDLSRIILWFY